MGFFFCKTKSHDFKGRRFNACAAVIGTGSENIKNYYNNWQNAKNRLLGGGLALVKGVIMYKSTMTSSAQCLFSNECYL